MDCYSKQELHVEETASEFDGTFITEMKLLESDRSLPVTIGNYCLILKKFATTNSSTLQIKIDKYRNKFLSSKILAPGFPGYQDIQLKHISAMLTEQCQQVLLFIENIEHDFLPMFKGMLINSSTTMNKVSSQTKEAEQIWRAIKSEMQDNDKTINTILKEMGGHKKKLVKMHQDVLEYTNTVKLQKYLAKKLNIAYVRYCKIIKDSLVEMKLVCKARHDAILDFACKLADFYTTISSFYTAFYKTIQNSNNELDAVRSNIMDLYNYCVSHRICRQYIGDETYSKYIFKSNEILLDSSSPYAQYPHYDPPLLFAEAIRDFVGIENNEISCYKGQKIFLYEQPVDKWVLASTNRIFPTGYVPTNVIKLINVKTGFAIKWCLAQENKLPVFPGELLFIEYETDDGYWCTNSAGASGYVDRFSIVLEKTVQ